MAECWRSRQVGGFGEMGDRDESPRMASESRFDAEEERSARRKSWRAAGQEDGKSTEETDLAHRNLTAGTPGR